MFFYIPAALLKVVQDQFAGQYKDILNHQRKPYLIKKLALRRQTVGYFGPSYKAFLIVVKRSKHLWFYIRIGDLLLRYKYSFFN
jgi:hypothetical protein